MTANPAQGVRIDRSGPLRRTAAGRIAIPLTVGKDGARVGEGDLVLTNDAAEMLQAENSGDCSPSRFPRLLRMSGASDVSTNEALPQGAPKHITQERIRRAHLAEAAAGGFDGFMSLDWIRDSGASVSQTLVLWDQGQLAELPAGKGWDVVRMDRPRGWRTVTALRTAGAEIGPVLHTETHVEVLVPLGSVAEWDQDGATVLAEGELLQVPPPAVVAPHTLNARSWIVPPGASLTDGMALYEAYAAASASMAMDGTR